ncbi:MAG: nuclear transport factor 2 family protein [Cyclobacteriaceae bacterium]
MKNLLIRLFALIIVSTLFLFVGSAYREKADVNKEMEAVKAAIQESSDAYHAKDINRLSAIWVNDENVVRIGAAPGGNNFSKGWESRKKVYTDNFKNYPELTGNKEVNSNFNIKIYSQSAWAVYDMELKSKEGETLRKARHTSILEKEKGIWKLTYLSTVILSAYENRNDNLETSATYHELNPVDIDNILADDFIGRNEQSRQTWNVDAHRNYLNAGSKSDSIVLQMARGNWVATMFERKMEGREKAFQAMQFKRFENGKIAEIFEYGDRKQND